MESSDGAKRPDSDTDWQAIDIFVFSNGQQHSPPRKYHLQAEDINLWKSTLSFLAKTHYGPFHSTVDLYTTEGTRILSPLELSNGGSYVAVQPPDSFVYAGYDKYLIKASRSWEKRRTRKHDNTPESDKSKTIPDLGNIAEVIENALVQTNKASKLLDKIASNVTNQDVSTITKPHLMSALARNTLNTTNPSEKKKIYIQPPLFIKKITPTVLPAPSIRNNLFKVKDSSKLTSGAKITRPDRQNSLGSSYSVSNSSNKLGPKNKSPRPPNKAKDSSLNPNTIQPKSQEITRIASDMKITSTINSLVTNKDEGLTTTTNPNLQNVIEDKELLSVANIYENPHKELPSIAFSPNPMQSKVYAPVRQSGTTALISETGCNDDTIKSDIKIVSHENNTNDYGRDFLESIKITHNLDKNKSREMMKTGEIIDPINEINGNLLNIYQTNIPEFEKPKPQDSPPRKRSVTIDELGEETQKEANVDNKVGNNLTNKVTTSFQRSTESIEVNYSPTQLTVMSNRTYQINIPELEKPKPQDSPPRKHSETIDELVEETQEEANVNKVGNNLTNVVTTSSQKSTESIKVNYSPTNMAIMSNRVTESLLVTQKTQETSNLLSTTTNKIISDNYKATMKKGDVINLKFKIEIENSSGGFLKPNDNSVIQTEKESQINIDDQFIAQNKSFTTLIRNEIKEHNPGDNNQLIVVQCGNCKFCNDLHEATNKKVNENYIIMLPIAKFKETNDRCRCSQSSIEIQKPNVGSALQSISRNSKVDTEQLVVDTSTQNNNMNLIPELKPSEDPVTHEIKKSVLVTNQLTQPNTREPSTLIQESDGKSELVIASLDSMGTRMKNEEKSTQTDWCDVLLEVKLLSDGHYSFRLPPLELLKYHKLT